MKTSQLPLLNATDGSEELVIVRGTGTAKETALLPPGLLVGAAVKPTPAELQAAILAALVAGADIALTQNEDGTVSVSIVDSPNFTGTPHAPTANPGTNTTQIATTAFVEAAAAALQTAVNGKQATLEAGTGITLHDNGDGTFTISATGSSTASALTDGVYGDVTVSNGGTKMTVTNVTNGTVTVADEAYSATWSGKLSVPTKNSVFNQIETVKTSINGKVPSSAVGAASGVASLDATGKVPAGQLPSYVDDVLEFSNAATFPGTGETGKIYVALDTNAQWRWTGSTYIQLVASPGTTDNVPEGATNKYYTDVRVRAAVMTGLATVVGTPAATDSLLTVLGKLWRQAYTQVLPLTGGIVSGTLQAGDITTTRGDGTGALFLGDSSHYLYWDKSNYSLPGGGLEISGGGVAAQYYNTSGATGAYYVNCRDGNSGATGIYSPSANDLRFNNAGGDVLQITSSLIQANKPIVGAGFDATYNVAFKQSRTGQVGYHMYNGGATCEWLTYQPAHASGDDYRIATYVGGVTTDRFKIGADGTGYFMYNFYVANELWVNSKVIRFGGAGSSQFIFYDGNKFQINGVLNTNGFDFACGNAFLTGALTVQGAAGGVTYNDRAGGTSYFSSYNYGGIYRIYSSVGGGDKWTLDSSGNGWFAGNITSASDARLKSNIREMMDGLDIVTKLRGVRFEQNDGEHVGVIAQEVREVLPEVVLENEEGFLSVDYGRITAVLIEAVKTLTGRVADLEARLAA